MLDKLNGNEKENKSEKNKNSPPDLRKNDDKKSSDVGGKIKDLVGKISTKKPKNEKKSPDAKRKARPMPKPRIRPKSEDKGTLKPKEPKKPKKPKISGRGLGEGFGRKIPDDDQKTIIGAAVFGLILIILVASGYYFLVYAPYQETLQEARTIKLNEVNAYYKGPLAADPQRQQLIAEIEEGVTPEQILAVDVLGPATDKWRTYQNQQININRDDFNRVMIVYDTDVPGPQGAHQTRAASEKSVIMRVEDARRFVSQADASLLANIEIQTPDTVAVPIIISRLQAAGGLISVGNMVDVYLRVEPEAQAETDEERIPINEEGQESPAQSPAIATDETPAISGATVLAILRARESGAIDARYARSQSFTVDQISSLTQREQTATANVEQLLRAASAGGFDEAQTRALLQNYGIRLSDFERTSNLGELDAQYLLLLEVPREDVLLLIQNMDEIILTLPTQQAPTWLINELRTIYA